MFGTTISLLIAVYCAYNFAADAKKNKWFWAIVGGLCYEATYQASALAIFYLTAYFTEFVLFSRELIFRIELCVCLYLAAVLTKLLKKRFIVGDPLKFAILIANLPRARSLPFRTASAATLAACTILAMAAWTLWPAVSSTINGSSRISLEIDRDQPPQVVASAEVINRSMTVIARRLREFRVTNWTLRAEGNDRIAIDLPGTKDLEALTVARWVGVSAKLDFRLVNTTVSLSPQEVIQGRVPTDSEVLYEQEGGQRVPILVYKQTLVAGEDLVDAQPSFDARTGEPDVSFRFNLRGGQKFAQVTSENVGRLFAIVLDGKVISAPRIVGPITGGSGQITGNFTVEQANNLAVLLRVGTLPVKFKSVKVKWTAPFG